MAEQKALDSVTRSLMTIKMQQIKSSSTPETQQAKASLWGYCYSSFETLVRVCESKQWDQARIIVEKIRLIVIGLPQENFGSRLLREAFLEMEEMYILNADMNVLLLQFKVFPVLEWDTAIVNYVENCPG